MRVVSLVPSWTETLLQAGVNVVGRTRFCIHPREKVATIPVVGGTKDWDLEKLRALYPDILVLDKEENPKFMGDQFPFVATHVDSIASMPGVLSELSARLKHKNLEALAERWSAIDRWNGLSDWKPGDRVPGLIEWGREPTESVRRLVYVIWRNPWMAVGRDTFIGSVLGKCGFGSYLPDFATKYPEFKMEDLTSADTLFLFSSEPFPFLRNKADIGVKCASPHAFVDGECFSWFGIRTLSFLEGLKARD